MSQKSANLHRARAAKNDEFYTQYADVKKECDNYLSHFFNKIIYCNCDTADSAFVKYFMALKARGQIRDVWFSGGLNGDDFRCAASIEKLTAADIIVTNPPFSLFREFIDLLVRYNKKFLVIGNMNAVAYKNMFRAIKDKVVYTGYAAPKKFMQPNGELRLFGNICWYTNICDDFKSVDLMLNKQYYGNEYLYPKYDNADAINVNRIADIPSDYFGVMGVPITFLTINNLQQFDIIGLDKDCTYDKRGVVLQGQKLYHRVMVRRRRIASNDNRMLKMAA